MKQLVSTISAFAPTRHVPINLDNLLGQIMSGDGRTADIVASIGLTFEKGE